jgi:hypothetical protein
MRIMNEKINIGANQENCEITTDERQMLCRKTGQRQEYGL